MTGLKGPMHINGVNITDCHIECNHTRHYLLHTGFDEDNDWIFQKTIAQYCPQCGVKLKGEGDE